MQISLLMYYLNQIDETSRALIMFYFEPFSRSDLVTSNDDVLILADDRLFHQWAPGDPISDGLLD